MSFSFRRDGKGRKQAHSLRRLAEQGKGGLYSPVSSCKIIEIETQPSEQAAELECCEGFNSRKDLILSEDVEGFNSIDAPEPTSVEHLQGRNYLMMHGADESATGGI